MLKTRGLSSCSKRDINMFGEKTFKKYIHLKLEGRVREIESVTTAAEILKVQLEETTAGKPLEKALNIFFKVQLKVAYILAGSSDIRIYTLRFLEDIKINIPKEFYDKLKDYTHIDEGNCEVFVERIKAELGENNDVGLAFYVTATASFKKLETLDFKAAFNTGEENLFNLNLGEGKLLQRTFFFDNSIEDWALKGREGFLLVKEKEESIYLINEEGLNKIIFFQPPGKVLKVLKVEGDNLVVVAEREGQVNIYLYNEGFLDLVAKDIYKKVVPLYVPSLKALIYGRSHNEEIDIVKITLEGPGEEATLVTFKGSCSCLCVARSEAMAAVAVGPREIFIFSLKGQVSTHIKATAAEAVCGTITDLRFALDEDRIFMKTEENQERELYQVFISRGIFRRILGGDRSMMLNDYTLALDDSQLYFSASQEGGTNIYVMNLNSLDKELLLELNSSEIEFLST